MSCGRPAHGSCQNICCRSCCIKRGGCLLRAHKLIQPSPGSSQTTQTQSPPHLPVSAAPRPISPTFAIDPALDADPVLQLQRQDELVAETERNFSEQEQELERQEEEDFQRALAASREGLYALMSASSPDVSTPHVPGNNIVPASTASLPGPILQQLSSSASVVVGGRPVTQVSTSNKPAITSHLPPNWMRPHEDRTQQPQALTGRGQLDVEIVNRFRVVWWETVCLHFAHSSSVLKDCGFRTTRHLQLSSFTFALIGRNGEFLTVQPPSSALARTV